MEPQSTQDTARILITGRDEAVRLAGRVAARDATMTPATRRQVTHMIFKAYVKQAQADGLLPMNLKVTPAGPALSGGVDVDVWDPLTGTGWALTGEGSPGPAANGPAEAVVPDGNATRTLTEVHRLEYRDT
jgi:hypothetical protein